MPRYFDVKAIFRMSTELGRTFMIEIIIIHRK